MDLMDFFNLEKSFDQVDIKGSQTGGIVKCVLEDQDGDYQYDTQKPRQGQEYAQYYQEEEQRQLLQTCYPVEESAGDINSELLGIEEDTLGSTIPHVDDLREELTDIYNQYDFNQVPDSKLPIAAHREEIVNMIESNQVVIIQGQTGCGKTTQVGQYILDHYAAAGKYCNIIVTQPRRIAAMSISRRVCDERGWRLGTVVGYQVGLDRENISEDTCLCYVTTGILKRKLVTKKHMNDYTHVILDEVHERDQDSDFVLLIVRKLLRQRSRGVKVVLMSATLDVGKFSEYFSFPVHNRLEQAPIVTIGKKSFHEIREFYLGDLKKLGTLPDVFESSPCLSEELYKIAVKLITAFDRMEVLGQGCSTDHPPFAPNRGSVLIFLPGINEITEMKNALEEESNRATQGESRNKYKWWVLPLHSTITREEQQLVFQIPERGCRKIILATNIAESSITVPDITYVVDFCLTKNLVCDPDTNYCSLRVEWASQANCMQRRGRVGRVSAGRVYRMIPLELYKILPDEGRPEIMRCPLDLIVLNAKLLDMGEPKALLSLAIDPPDLTNIERTILTLKEVGALLLTVSDGSSQEGRYSPHDGDLTFIGHVMAELPVDVRIGKLIVLGHIFNVLEECVIIGAGLSVKSIFSTPFNQRLRAYHSKLSWADMSHSDCIAVLNAYQVWRNHVRSGEFLRGGRKKKEAEWCGRHFIQMNIIHEMDQLVEELNKRLRKLGIEKPRGQGAPDWNEVDKSLVLKIVIFGAFYPNYYIRGEHYGQLEEKEALRFVMGHDLHSTVLLKGLPMNQPMQLYSRKIRALFKDCYMRQDDIKLEFDNTKLYATFPKPKSMCTSGRSCGMGQGDTSQEVTGKIVTAVYTALKMKQLRIPLSITVLPPEEARRRMESAQDFADDRSDISSHSEFSSYRKTLSTTSLEGPVLSAAGRHRSKTLTQVPLPKLDQEVMEVMITYVIDPGHFWVRYAEDHYNQQFIQLNAIINSNPLRPFQPVQDTVVIGDLYLAPYEDGSQLSYYRARVDAISSIVCNGQQIEKCQVFFVDYGNAEDVWKKDLRMIDKFLLKNRVREIPMQAVECVLTGVKPSLLKSPHGLWTEESKVGFEKMTCDKILGAKVYSVVRGIVSVELIQFPLQKSLYGGQREFSINKWLVGHHAEETQEGYLSKQNHELREHYSELEDSQKEVYDQKQAEELQWDDMSDVQAPTEKECKIRLSLKGPYSPLEMKMYSLSRSGLIKETRIEWDSVNSVLLDPDPQDTHHRWLVAGHVGLTTKGDTLQLRHTTMMPNIHGLGALLALIFCPRAELRSNHDRSLLTGAICGLGYNPATNKALYPDHDMEIIFDTEVNLFDIQTINCIRFRMNNLLTIEGPERYPENLSYDIITSQKKIKDNLLTLLQKHRKPQELLSFPRQYQWNQIPPEVLLDPGVKEKFSIFSLHPGIRYNQETLERKNKELHAAARKSSQREEHECILCHAALPTPLDVLLHLQQQKHRENEEEYIGK